jgi:RNA-directed DNA polymerase
MLEALEKGVKGGVWFSLIDKVYRPKTLYQAWHKVKANKGGVGTDYQSLEGFERNLEQNLHRLQEELRTGSYQPRPIRRGSTLRSQGVRTRGRWAFRVYEIGWYRKPFVWW